MTGRTVKKGEQDLSGIGPKRNFNDGSSQSSVCSNVGNVRYKTNSPTAKLLIPKLLILIRNHDCQDVRIGYRSERVSRYKIWSIALFSPGRSFFLKIETPTRCDLCSTDCNTRAKETNCRRSSQYRSDGIPSSIPLAAVTRAHALGTGPRAFTLT